MSTLAWFWIAIGIIMALVILFAFVTATVITLGFRSRDDAHYDPEDKQWHPFVALTEEQQSRRVPGTRKLKGRDTNSKITSNMHQIKLLPFEELIKNLDEKGIEYDKWELEKAYFPLKDVEACMNSEKTAKMTPFSNLRACPLCGKPSEELKWIWFKSPQWTWQKLCGRAGPMSICPDCGCIVEFKLHIMN